MRPHSSRHIDLLMKLTPVGLLKSTMRYRVYVFSGYNIAIHFFRRPRRKQGYGMYQQQVYDRMSYLWYMFILISTCWYQNRTEEEATLNGFVALCTYSLVMIIKIYRFVNTKNVVVTERS